MAIYYIDYENVHNAGLHGVETLTEADCVHIFYKDSDTMQLPVVKCLLDSKASVRFERVRRTTLNALDFQLLAELFCSADQKCENYIISHDKGYDSAIDVARAHGISLQRKEAIDAPDFLRPQMRIQKPETPAAEAENEEPVEEASEGAVENIPAVTESEEVPQAETVPVDEAAVSTEVISQDGTVKAAEENAEAVTASASAEAPVQKADVPSRRNSRRSRGNRRRSSVAHSEETIIGQDPPAVPADVNVSVEPLSETEVTEPTVTNAPVFTPEDDAVKIASVVAKNNIANVGEADYGMIAEAVRHSDNKNRFYQYFVKALGADKGQQFYRGIKAYYLKFVEALK